MANVTIEVDIDAQGNVKVTPNPAVAGDGDTVTWHVNSNAKGGGTLKLTLPGGAKSPFGNESDSISGIEKPARCNSMGQADPLKWPAGVTSYGYSVGFSGSPLLSLFRGTLVKQESAAPVIENDYVFPGEEARGRVHIVNRYFFGGDPHGPIAAARSRVHLEHCVAYRAWRNQTGAAHDRTVSVYPSAGEFPAGSDVTIFVAPDAHTGAPPAGSNPTSVGNGGDAVAKNVPNGSAVFVHYKQGTAQATRVDADISDSA